MIKAKRYTGEMLNELRLPLGGIGAGCVSLNGAGRLVDWEVSGYANKDSSNGLTHFALKAEDGEGCVWVRALHGDEPGGRMGAPRGYGFGQPRETLGGLPHFPEVSFDAAWPMATLGYAHEGFPGRAELTAFSPFIPLDSENSSLPAAFFEWEVFNTKSEPLTYTLCLSVTNPFDAAGAENHHHEADGVHSMLLEGGVVAQEPRKCGELMATVLGDGQVSWQEYWYRGSWFDALQVFWEDFTAPGPFKNRNYAEFGAGGDTASLAISQRVPAGESWKARFILNWHYPWMSNDWNPPAGADECDCASGCGCEPKKGKPENRWRKWYAVRFPDIFAVQRHCVSHYDRLKARTRQFVESVTNSTLPEPMRDAALSTLACLVTPLTLRLPDGSFYGFEGLCGGSGCCEGSCDHVWNYAYALCYLFPDLERSMRDLDMKYNLDEDGGLRFRLQLPLGRERSGFIPCADGHFGGVVKLWRDYLLCGDIEWLRGHWPDVKRMLGYAWNPDNPCRWDPDKTGVLWGRQHHTLDMELFGPNSWLTSLYLAALKAGEKMAALLGDCEAAQEYREILERGRQWSSEHLFNGEYFIQSIDLKDREMLRTFREAQAVIGGTVEDIYWDEEHGQIKYQIGQGCAIDQVLGQWHANLSGLGDILDKVRVKSALASIRKYNYMDSARDFFNPCRLYCVNDEAGTLICAYPEGAERPAIPVPYCQETMHGFEYQAACHMLEEGMAAEALELVKAVRDRYDGRYRNPFNEIECGSNYARSMAAFALLPSAIGMAADIGREYLKFNPPVEGDIRCFFSVAPAWGEFERRGGGCAIRVLHGSLRLNEVGLPFMRGKASVTLDGKAIAAERTEQGFTFSAAVEISAGHELQFKQDE